MPNPRFTQEDPLLRVIKDVGNTQAELRRQAANIPLFDVNSENTPATLDADQNDYDPGNCDVIRLAGDFQRTITGLQGGVKGRALHIHNCGSNPILFPVESALSAAANRIAGAWGDATVRLEAGMTVRFYYDKTTLRWIPASGSGNAGRPAASVSISANVSLVDSTDTLISWTVEEEDNASIFDPLNPTYLKAPAAGWYWVGLQVTFDANANGGRAAWIRHNGGNIAADRRSAEANGYTSIHLSGRANLTQGGLVQAYVRQESGGALALEASVPLQIVTRLSLQAA